MIIGIVNSDLEATVRLNVHGAAGKKQRIRAVIDTGYDGWLTLPPTIIAELGLTWQRRGRAILADGKECAFDIYLARVVWDRRRLSIPVDELDTTPLIGTALLADHEFKAVFRRRSKVTIRRTRR